MDNSGCSILDCGMIGGQPTVSGRAACIETTATFCWHQSRLVLRWVQTLLQREEYDPALPTPRLRSGTSCRTAVRCRLRGDRSDGGSVFQHDQREGGINGRKINFITYDDAYSPPKTVEQARKLVESDEDCSSSRASVRRPTMPSAIHESEEGATALCRNRGDSVR